MINNQSSLEPVEVYNSIISKLSAYDWAWPSHQGLELTVQCHKVLLETFKRNDVFCKQYSSSHRTVGGVMNMLQRRIQHWQKYLAK